LEENNNLFIEKIFANKPYTNRDIYRIRVARKAEFAWKVSYKYSDLFISSSRDISSFIPGKIIDFYSIIEKEIKENPDFEKSLVPLKSASCSNRLLAEMNEASRIFNVGPMAAVAGSLCEFISRDIQKDTRYLIIENGGDVFVKSNKDIVLSVFLKNNYFRNGLKLKIDKKLLPCGIASSSGTFGHSLSLGRCDIALVVARNAVIADAAATAFANSVKSKTDLEEAVNRMKDREGIFGLLAVKEEMLAIYGQISLI
jgi:ApbE superfamily uncharacterized protein (UPF0280 family)